MGRPTIFSILVGPSLQYAVVHDLVATYPAIEFPPWVSPWLVFKTRMCTRKSGNFRTYSSVG